MAGSSVGSLAPIAPVWACLPGGAALAGGQASVTAVAAATGHLVVAVHGGRSVVAVTNAVHSPEAGQALADWLVGAEVPDAPPPAGPWLVHSLPTPAVAVFLAPDAKGLLHLVVIEAAPDAVSVWTKPSDAPCDGTSPWLPYARCDVPRLGSVAASAYVPEARVVVWADADPPVLSSVTSRGSDDESDDESAAPKNRDVDSGSRICALALPVHADAPWPPVVELRSSVCGLSALLGSRSNLWMVATDEDWSVAYASVSRDRLAAAELAPSSLDGPVIASTIHTSTGELVVLTLSGRLYVVSAPDTQSSMPKRVVLRAQPLGCLHQVPSPPGLGSDGAPWDPLQAKALVATREVVGLVAPAALGIYHVAHGSLLGKIAYPSGVSLADLRGTLVVVPSVADGRRLGPGDVGVWGSGGMFLLRLSNVSTRAARLVEPSVTSHLLRDAARLCEAWSLPRHTAKYLLDAGFEAQAALETAPRGEGASTQAELLADVAAAVLDFVQNPALMLALLPGALAGATADAAVADAVDDARLSFHTFTPLNRVLKAEFVAYLEARTKACRYSEPASRQLPDALGPHMPNRPVPHARLVEMPLSILAAWIRAAPGPVLDALLPAALASGRLVPHLRCEKETSAAVSAYSSLLQAHASPVKGGEARPFADTHPGLALHSGDDCEASLFELVVLALFLHRPSAVVGAVRSLALAPEPRQCAAYLAAAQLGHALGAIAAADQDVASAVAELYALALEVPQAVQVYVARADFDAAFVLVEDALGGAELAPGVPSEEALFSSLAIAVLASTTAQQWLPRLWRLVPSSMTAVDLLAVIETALRAPTCALTVADVADVLLAHS
ncbi:uncharacterized protein AMSG_03343 [Thecamonas trahens ATCC 50062]|uniref:CNH domain-containing protein n=1 Tax=Thecamonas trahens ATCC 50062 TaxID=461836 RepID=A0A0L0D3K9_THETB|nr:hypothetical protein AMSG_03343 [Thecamonas trahens ATCC 50062]KNC46912.1 hypothetical protein AMSG_03343 [Thecamonas trahens ATCC 50062]|eukprot:XP_013760185.1 hypothetical protein AMSG_03343 [Thecamonas trahens ATCC 50062]